MNWHYRCPNCNEWRVCDWDDRRNTKICNKYETDYQVPSPSEQHDAYVDTHDWPNEMEVAVIASKGNKCCVPGCGKNYQTLDHRIPWSKRGKTCVDNLYPMCNEHNKSKGDEDWATWLEKDKSNKAE